MSLADLSLGEWRMFDLPTAQRVAGAAAARVGGRVVAVETIVHLGAPLHRVRIERAGGEFALIPGGSVELGFDLDGWQPAPEQEADYAASVAEGYGYGPDLRSHLAQVLSPRRNAVVDTVLMAVEAEALSEIPAEMAGVLAERGLRMPTADEWEHACGVGARTLFRWGNECPLDRIPYGDSSGPQNLLNGFGLRIAYDTYSTELTSDESAIHGGDGGESVCGAYGNLLGWLPLATANHNPSLVELVYGSDGEDMFDDFSTRPVLAL